MKIRDDGSVIYDEKSQRMADEIVMAEARHMAQRRRDGDRLDNLGFREKVGHDRIDVVGHRHFGQGARVHRIRRDGFVPDPRPELELYH